VLLQRAARGRDELELRRLDEAEKRGNRFRCMVQVRMTFIYCTSWCLTACSAWMATGSGAW
jgi:hypothetical protein